jgi:hypothetical protein
METVTRFGSSMALALLGLAAFTGTASAAAPVNETSPTISGNYRVGQTLAASQGEWSGNPTAFFYQWLRCNSSGGACAPIPGATDPEYRLADADLGARLRVEVVASNGDGSSAAARSARTPLIKLPVPTLVTKPVVSGIPREGQTLSASTGSWTNNPTSFTYQWRRCPPGATSCLAIPGATEQTYLSGGADVGSRLRVRVKAFNAGGGSQSAGSEPTPAIKPAAAGFRLGRVTRDPKRGLARMRVRVPEAGSVKLLRTRRVRTERRDVDLARKFKLTVRPRAHARHRLRERGRLRVRVAVRFDPQAGAPRTKHARVVLKSSK